jgi:hypothetical protein
MTRAATSARTVGAGWFLVPGTAVMILLLWRMYCTIERVQWNAPRLVPSFALADGINFYGTRAAGPFLGWVYGPVFPLYLLPAALVPGLNGTFALAWLLNLAAFLGPAWLVARRALPGRPAAAIAMFFWAALSLSAEVSQTQFYYLHVDTLCIGLTLLAAWALARAVAAPESRGGLHVAAAGAALAIWTKQSAVAAPAIFALWLVWSGRPRVAARLMVWVAAYVGLMGAVFVAWFGREALWFNLVQIHLHNPARTDGTGRFFGQLLASSPGWLLAALALLLVRQLEEGGSPASKPPARTMENLLLWLAVGNLPLGLVAATKVAGGWNSLHSLNYALLWLALALARQTVSGSLSRPGRLVLGLASLALLASGWTAAEAADLRWRPGTMQATDLAYARAHAGRLYLPWNPLITLITDRKIYPFDDALLCLARAGLEPPAAAVRREMPHGALVVYPDPAQSQFALTYLNPDPPRPNPPPPSHSP